MRVPGLRWAVLLLAVGCAGWVVRSFLRPEAVSEVEAGRKAAPVEAARPAVGVEGPREPVSGPPIRPTPPPPIRLRVLEMPGARPLGGQAVEWAAPAVAGNGETDEHGELVLSGIPASPVIVRVAAEDHLAAMQVIAAGEREVEIEVWRFSSLEVEVVDPAGSPLEGVRAFVFLPRDERDPPSPRLAVAEQVDRWRRSARELAAAWARLRDDPTDEDSFQVVLATKRRVEAHARGLHGALRRAAADAALSGTTDEEGRARLVAPRVPGTRWFPGPEWIVRSIEPDGGEPQRGYSGALGPASGVGRPLRAVVARSAVVVGRVPVTPDAIGRPRVTLLHRSGHPLSGAVTYSAPPTLPVEVERDGRFRFEGVPGGWSWINAFWQERGQTESPEYFIAGCSVEVVEGRVHDVGTLPVEGTPPVRLRIRFVGPGDEEYAPEQVLREPSSPCEVFLRYDAGPDPLRFCAQAIELPAGPAVLLWGLYEGGWSAKMLLSPLTRFRPEFADTRGSLFPEARFHVPETMEVAIEIPIEAKVPLSIVARGAEAGQEYVAYLVRLGSDGTDPSGPCWLARLGPAGEETAAGLALVPPGEYEVLVVPDPDSRARRCAFLRTSVEATPSSEPPSRLTVSLADGDAVEVRGPPGEMVFLTLRRYERVPGAELVYREVFDPRGLAIVHGVPPGQALGFGKGARDGGQTLVGGQPIETVVEILGPIGTGGAAAGEDRR